MTSRKAAEAQKQSEEHYRPADLITYNSTFTLNDAGNIEEFKELANTLRELAQGEEGTLHYDYFASEDELIFSFLEYYADSDAAIIHGDNNGEFVKKMLTLSTVKLEVFGNPSQALKDTLDGIKPIYYSWAGGVKR